jgi:hypothetical protein
MIKKWDGLPTTRYLRHRNVEIEKPTRERYKARLAKLTGLSFPSAEDEACDPLAADAIYASAIAALRERRRGKTYRLVFNENYNYGMTRNLLGLRRRESHGKVLIKRLRRADRSSPVSPRSRFSIWEKAHYPMRGAFDAVSASDGLVCMHRILGISGSPSSDTSQCRTPACIHLPESETTISSKCQRGQAFGLDVRKFLAITGPNLSTQRRIDSLLTMRPRSAKRSSTSR